ncbi:GTP cyclohydrolase I FolE2 [Nocardia niigatensis]
MHPDNTLDVRGVRELTADVTDREAFFDRETDIPASQPSAPISVARAGITAQTVRLSVPSLLGDGTPMSLVGDVDVFAGLPANRRGVHMSRMVEVVTDLDDRPWESLHDYMRALTTAVADRQKLDLASTHLRAQATVTRPAPATGRPSRDTFKVEASAEGDGTSIQVRVGVGATVMTACPCTQAWTRYQTIEALLEPLGEAAANEFGFRHPTFTHSQRGVVWAHADTGVGGVDLNHLFEAIDAGAHLTFELLKRSDEHELVRRAHATPQFTEDVVRDVTAHLIGKYPHLLAPTARVTVLCRNYESIHPHDAVSKVSDTAAALIDMCRLS